MTLCWQRTTIFTLFLLISAPILYDRKEAHSQDDVYPMIEEKF